MKKAVQLRVLHAPSSVGGNSQGLSRHLRLLGIESEVWSLAPSPFGYPADRIIWGQQDGFLLREWKRLRAIWAAAREFDIIHFNFGTTFAERTPFRRDAERKLISKLQTAARATYRCMLFHLELTLYRLNGRITFIHYQGDDARQGDFSLTHFKYTIAKHVESGYYCRFSDCFKRKMIRTMSRNCKQVYAVNPDLLHVLGIGARFIPYCHISLDDWMPHYNEHVEHRLLRIGHAPSHRGVKGTDLVLGAVERLRSEGFQFELDLIEGVPNEIAKKRYAHVDVFVDQLHAGWYGGLAVEAMALGKPVLVYLREEDLKFIPSEMRADLPFIQVTPETIEDCLRRVLIMSRKELHELGRKSRSYVERWHDPIRIAAEIKRDYQLALGGKGRI